MRFLPLLILCAGCNSTVPELTHPADPPDAEPCLERVWMLERFNGMSADDGGPAQFWIETCKTWR